MPADSTVSVLQDARNVRIHGGTINAVAGDMTIFRSGPSITNFDSHNMISRTFNNSNNNFSRNNYSTHTTRNVHAGTINNFDSAQNVNTGANRGAISQDDNRGVASWNPDNNLQRGYDYQRAGGQGSRPAYPHIHTGPAAGPPYTQGPRYYADHPPYQPPHADPLGGFPPGTAHYQNTQYGGPLQRYPPGIRPMNAMDQEFLRAALAGIPSGEEGWDDSDSSDDEERNPRAGPLSAEGFTPASYPRDRAASTASAPPSIASSKDSAQGGSPSSLRSNNPYRDPPFKDQGLT